MPGINKAILLGRLGKDPETRYTQDGKAICNFTVATSEDWKDKSGEKQSRTEWHKISCFGKLAEICGQYLQKGSQCYIEGKIQTREWTDKAGEKRYTTEIIASDVQFLGGKTDQEPKKQPAKEHDYNNDPDDGIPF